MKKKIFLTIGITLALLIIAAILYFMSSLFAQKTDYFYGPYTCEGGQNLTVHQTVVRNELEGVTKDITFLITFGPYSLRGLVYPPFSENTVNGITSVQYMNASQKEQYIQTTTSSSADFRTDAMVALARQYQITTYHSQELISDTHMTDNDFQVFTKCFDTYTEDIYKNIIEKTQDTHLGTRASKFVELTKAYNRK